ncbi:K-box region and MADS-box transcription factor family protein [Striga asiatica]|uniref:K-box region and MADS-box transcription factor family protein n=1 Tax=Striga asiatica TaxID=4170 RepID=A0A5A7QN97_STRAF|nr:K-box region and MADS-box transcription factor family protein [Striga asiatica]
MKPHIRPSKLEVPRLAGIIHPGLLNCSGQTKPNLLNITLEVGPGRRRGEMVDIDTALCEKVKHLVFEAAEGCFCQARSLRWRRQGRDLGYEMGKRLVGHRVDSHARQLLLQLRVPVVLHVVYGMKSDYSLLLGLGELAVFEVRPQIISPPQSAALAASLQT